MKSEILELIEVIQQNVITDPNHDDPGSVTDCWKLLKEKLNESVVDVPTKPPLKALSYVSESGLQINQDDDCGLSWSVALGLMEEYAERCLSILNPKKP